MKRHTKIGNNREQAIVQNEKEGLDCIWIRVANVGKQAEEVKDKRTRPQTSLQNKEEKYQGTVLKNEERVKKKTSTSEKVHSPKKSSLLPLSVLRTTTASSCHLQVTIGRR